MVIMRKGHIFDRK